MKYKELYIHTVSQLKKSGISDCESDARILFEFCTGMNIGNYILKQNEEAQEQEINQLKRFTDKRIRHIPVQYLTNKAYFYGLEFYVDNSVLIPRADTEVLVEEALKLTKSNDRILDLCTGSACIAISIIKKFPDIELTATDISAKALKTAKRNASLHAVSISFIQSNLFDKINNTYNIIVSNPPYIKSEEVKKLDDDVKENEPILALDGGNDGLDFYRKILKEARHYLRENGYILFEIGFDQGMQVRQLTEEAGYRNIKLIKDLCGKDRVITAQQ